MSTLLTVLIWVLVLWTVLMIGLLVGMSVHRERTRRQRKHLLQERLDLERARALVAGRDRLIGL